MTVKGKAGLAREQEINFHNFFDASDDLLFVLNDKGIIIQINATVVRRLGYSAEELIGQSVLRVYPGARGSEAGQIVEKMLAGEEECCPVSLITKSGKLISTEIRITSGSWKGKTAFWGIVKDVSSLKLSEEKLDKVMDLADISKLKQAVNRLMAQNQESESLNQNLHDINKELEQRGRKKTVDLSVANQKLRTQFKKLMQAKEKQQRSIEIQTVLREIAEATMRTSSLKELYQTVRQSIKRVLPAKYFLISLLSEDASEIAVSFHSEEITAFQDRRPLGKDVTEYILRLGRSVLITQPDLDRLRESGEYRLEAAQKLQVCQCLGAPLIDSQGKALGTMALLVDAEHSFNAADKKVLSIIVAQFSMAIERIRITQELVKSTSLIRKSQKMAHLGSWSLDISTGNALWSDELYRILGLKPNEIAANSEAYLKRMHPKDRRVIKEVYLASVRSDKAGFECEHRILRNTSELRHVYVKCEHRRNSFGKITGSVGMIQDITDRKQAEEERRINAELNEVLKASGEATVRINSLKELLMKVHVGA
ncbi:MAG: putative signal transduction histidine kinase [Firmicutes bacterium]|nr:putative signal transduction histidine kinase [Bacillota bacterium]